MADLSLDLSSALGRSQVPPLIVTPPYFDAFLSLACIGARLLVI